MKPIEFPNNDHYYLTLAEEAFANGEDKIALENYKLAYQENPSPKLNRLIASLAVEQGEFGVAMEYAKEAAEDYLESVESIDLYIQIQLLVHRFFAAREFLWQAQKVKSITEEQKNLWLFRIDDQEDFYQKQQQAAMKVIEDELKELPKLSNMEQLLLIRKVRGLTNERLKFWAADFMLNSAVSPLVRSYLFESLARLGVNERFRYLTFQEEVVELIPVDTGFDTTLQQTIDELLTTILLDEDPVLLSNLIEQVNLEMVFLYPLQSSYNDAQAWVNSYLVDYAGIEADLNPQIEALRQKIKELMLGYH
ncbi:tetratricopeptide repeat protein [Enterococcus hailinensis]|uniref:tetratricopeptide repeat protein n=1 Tax=Enterococcus hailinensis TaxID=3238988 RepID=UPI0038B24D73